MSASHSSHFTIGYINPGTNLMGGWVGVIDGMDALGKRITKHLLSSQNLTTISVTLASVQVTHGVTALAILNAVI